MLAGEPIHPELLGSWPGHLQEQGREDGGHWSVDRPAGIRHRLPPGGTENCDEGRGCILRRCHLELVFEEIVFSEDVF